MKTRLFLSGLLLLLSGMVSAQNCISMETISLDFRNKCFRGIAIDTLVVKKGAFFNFEIKGINLNLYKVQIGKEDSMVTSDVSIPTFEVFGLDAITEVVAGIKEFTTSTEALEAKIESLNTLKSLKGDNISLNELKEINDRISEINAKIILLQADPVANAINKLKELRSSIRDTLEKAKNGVLTDLSEFSYERSQQPLYYLMVYTVQQIDDAIGRKTIPKIIKESDSLRSQLLVYQEKSENIKSQYSTYIKTPAVAELLDKDKGNQEVKALSEEVMNTLNEAEKVFNNALATISKEKMAAYLKDLIALINNSDTIYTSLPFQNNGDINKLSLVISPRKEEYGLQTYKADYLFPEKRSYAGISVSFYYSGMSDDVYSAVEEPLTDSTSQYKLINENPARGEIGIASLLHYGWKLKKDCVGIHLTIGPAISLDSKVKPRLAAGAGMGFGKTRNMFTVNVLGMAGYSDKLSKAYDENKDYGAKPENVTVSRLCASWAISLGYIYKF